VQQVLPPFYDLFCGLLTCFGEGVSRSATVVAAWLMASRNMTSKDSVEFLATRRSVIRPNPGFIRQLNAFEDEIGKQ
jgi:protein-tyrosine phosphatase